MRLYQDNSRSLGEYINDTFQHILRREGEITAQRNIAKFLDDYSGIAQKEENGVFIKENSKGLRSAYVEGTNIEGNIYSGRMASIWEEKAKEALDSTSNPYARKLINDKLQQHLLIEKDRWNKFESDLLEKDSLIHLEGIIQDSGRHITFNSYGDTLNEVRATINNSSVNPIKKLDLANKVPLFLSQSLMQKMSFETPQELLNLYNNDKEHLLFKGANINEVYRYLSQAKRNIKSANKTQGVILEVEKKDKLLMLEKYGQVDEEYFGKLHNIYQALGKVKKSLELERDLQKAGAYYKATTWLGQFDFEDANIAIEQLRPTKEDSKGFAIKNEIYDRLKSEYDTLKTGYQKDPAHFADLELMQNDNYVSQLGDTATIYQKRYLQQKSRGVINPKVLTNSEKDKYAQILLNKSDDEITEYLDKLNLVFKGNTKDVLIEISESSKIDSMLQMALHAKAYKGTDNFNYLLNVRRRSLSGELKEENFTDKENIKIMKELVYAGEDVGNLMNNLTPLKQQEIKTFLYEGSKAIYKDNGQKNINNAIKQTLKEFFDCVYDTSDNIIVPKFYKGIEGQREFSDIEIKNIRNNLKNYSNPEISEEYWDIKKMESIFGEVKSPSPAEQKNTINLVRHTIKNGRWVLTNDNSGYVYEMHHGNKTFYDTDEKGERKVFTLEKLSRTIPKIESQNKKLSFAEMIEQQGITMELPY